MNEVEDEPTYYLHPDLLASNTYFSKRDDGVTEYISDFLYPESPSHGFRVSVTRHGEGFSMFAFVLGKVITHDRVLPNNDPVWLTDKEDVDTLVDKSYLAEDMIKIFSVAHFQEDLCVAPF